MSAGQLAEDSAKILQTGLGNSVVVLVTDSVGYKLLDEFAGTSIKQLLKGEGVDGKAVVSI
jgi:hypothetical protein